MVESVFCGTVDSFRSWPELLLLGRSWPPWWNGCLAQSEPESMKFDNDHYVIAVSWRDDQPSLQKNRPLAEKRLKSTKRKLVKGPAIAGAYQKKIIEDYLGKKHILRVSPDEPTPTSEYHGFFVVDWILESLSSIDVIFSAWANWAFNWETSLTTSSIRTFILVITNRVYKGLKGTQSVDAHAHWIPFLSWFACHKTRVKQMRIRNTLNKPCRVKLVTIRNRDYRP